MWTVVFAIIRGDGLGSLLSISLCNFMLVRLKLCHIIDKVIDESLNSVNLDPNRVVHRFLVAPKLDLGLCV